MATVPAIDLLVIGAGIAGTAAAYAGARRGKHVVLVSAGSGASGLYSGALDWNGWERGGEPPEDAELGDFASALGCWMLGGGPCYLATGSGSVRGAWGRDTALLDLEPLRGGTVAVADVERDEWRAEALARALSASKWARGSGTRFEAVQVRGIAQGYERRLCAYDFAELLDASERRAWFVEQVAEVAARCDACLVGPWLGVRAETALEVRRMLGKPIGEVLSLPGGPSGARFEAARDALLERIEVTRRVGRVANVARVGSGFRAILLDGAGGERALEARAVVMAIGGVVGGGIEYRGSGSSAAGFVVSLEAPLALELDGEDATTFPALGGLDFTTAGFGVLERVGIVPDRAGGLADGGGTTIMSIAGDCVANEPRTALRAALGGLRAARRAVAEPSD